MPNATTHYVTWISRGRRGHGSAFADIAPATASVLTPGDTFQTPWASPSISWTDANGDIQTASFAFWSVSGGVDGGVISSPHTNTAPPVTAGPAEIVATAWYIQGGIGNGETGIFVDAFDVNQGKFVDDDFVSVTTDSSLSLAANQTGFVPSASPENIEAFSSIHAVPFTDWEVVLGTEPVSGRDCGLDEDSSAVAFAFYTSPTRVTLPTDLGQFSEVVHIYFGVIQDGGGLTNHGPVDPWGPLIRQFAVGISLAVTAQHVDAAVKGELLSVAAAQVTHATQHIVQAIRASEKI